MPRPICGGGGYSMRGLRRVLGAHWGKIACLVLGLGLAVGGSYYMWNQHRFGETAAHADGTIVGLHESSGTGEDSDSTYCPVVRFVTERREVVQFTDRTCSDPPPRIGTTVEVLYDPDHPQRAQLGATRWLVLGGVFTTFGFLITAGGVYSIARAVSRRHGHQRSGRLQDRPRPQDTDTD